MVHVAKVQLGTCKTYVRLHHAQCHMLQHWKMAAIVCTVLETLAFTKLNRQGTSILEVIGVTHAGVKEIHDS